MVGDLRRTFHKRDRLRQLRAFCQAARLGSITRAAAHLGLSQPAVSLHVRELENELEAALFERGGSGVSLTAAGERLYELADPLVRGMDGLSVDLTERIDDGGWGRLQIAASATSTSFVLPPYIKQFRARYPGVRLRVRSCRLSDGVALLHDGEVEFVLGMEESYTDVEYRELLLCDIVLITSLAHPLAGRDSISLEEVGAWPAIVPPPGTHSRQLGETATERFAAEANAVIEVSGWGAIKRYVEEGMGISVVPSVVLAETDRLSVIPLKKRFPTRSFGVFTRRGGFLTPPAHRFLRLMVPDFPETIPPPASDR